MTSKSTSKIALCAFVIGFSLSASTSAFAQYNPNIQNNAGNGMMDNATPYNPAPYNPVAATGTGYTNDGTLMMGGQKIGNPHQILHDLNVPSFFGVNADRLSFSDNPTYGQGTLAQMENHTLTIGVPAGNVVLSRLYLTPTNPYTEGVATPHNNYQTYQGVVADAQAGSYQLTVANDSKLYAFKTLGSMSTQSQNILIKELPAHSVFIANSDPKGGATAVRVTQNGDYAAMQNYFDTVKPYDFSWRSALAPYANDPNMAGATGAFFTNWVLGSDQVKAYQANLQSQTAGSGNEAFGVLAWDANQNKYVMLDPTNTQATAGSVSGNMPTLANNQFGFFGMHTHAGNATPSGQDFAMTQKLGLDQLVVGNNGTSAILTNNPSNNWQGQEFEFEDIRTDRRNGRKGITISAGDYSASLGLYPLPGGSTAVNGTLGWPGSGVNGTINTGIELSAATMRLGLSAIGLLSLAGGDPAAVITELGIQELANKYRELMYDFHVLHGLESALAAGIYGGANKGNSYVDNGRNYGGEDGNTSPDGSAINGFS